MSILTIIPARSGSKGIPQKNIRELLGKPLIAWTIEASLTADIDQRLIVSTDDENIAEISRSFGANVPFLRPAELSTDQATSLDVVLHALDWEAREEGFIPNRIMLLQPTSPLRTSMDIEEAVRLFDSQVCDAVISICEIQHPINWLVRLDSQGQIIPCQDFKARLRRQDSEKLYQPNGAIYLIDREALVSEHTFFPKRTLAYIMPPERSIDIDIPIDLYLAERLLRDRYEL